MQKADQQVSRIVLPTSVHLHAPTATTAEHIVKCAAGFPLAAHSTDKPGCHRGLRLAGRATFPRWNAATWSRTYCGTLMSASTYYWALRCAIVLPRRFALRRTDRGPVLRRPGVGAR
jgi:hypothetical protein